MDRFEQIRAFVGVVEAGGYSRAEQSTGTSRAVLSRNVIELEQRLGARLLHRTTRRVGLTEHGKLYYERCRSILDDLQSAEKMVSNRSAEPLGELRVAAPVNFGLNDLGAAFSEFLTRHPKVRIHLSLNDRPIDLAESYDVTIRVGEFTLPTSKKMIAFNINTSTRIICASPDYLRRRGVPERPQDLSSHECLCYSYVAEPTVWAFRHRDNEYRINVRSRIVTSAGPILRTGALRGLGIAYGPEPFFREEIEAGRLVRVLQDYRLPEVSVYAISPDDCYENATVAAFNEFMRSFLHSRGANRPKPA